MIPSRRPCLTTICLLISLLLSAPAWSQNRPRQRVTLREGHHAAWLVEEAPAGLLGAKSEETVTAWPENEPDKPVQFHARIVLEVKAGTDLDALLRGRGARLDRTIRSNLFVLQAPNARQALAIAQSLSTRGEVLTCHPVMQRPHELHGSYAPAPNDTYFPLQWHLERRASTGERTGVDMNVRAAWPVTSGEGVTIGVADNGVEYSHPDLQSRGLGMPHFNFLDHSTNTLPTISSESHSTMVAGLLVAERGNNRGVTGVAPLARFVNLRISTNSSFATDEGLGEMYSYRMDLIGIQNHSWGENGLTLIPIPAMEQEGITKSINEGRGGLGTIMVRSSGNSRAQGANANATGYLADSRVIAVGAVRFDGRVASYSNPGANLLLAAPSGDTRLPTLFTTDRTGTAGANYPNYTNDFGDYAANGSGFVGTSGSTPLVTGVAALALSANPSLSWRDMQQVLLLSSRHFDFIDYTLSTNGAGLPVSHNTGFGVPDAGVAVELARAWHNRPARVTVSVTNSTGTPIPDDGLHLELNKGGQLLSPSSATPAEAPYPDRPSGFLPLVDVGLATQPLSTNLTGKGALIQRGDNTFAQKVAYATQAGAAFVVIYNNTGLTNRQVIGSLEAPTLPVVMISQNEGNSLHTLLLQTNLTAQLAAQSARYTFDITNTLCLEQVGLTLATSHSRRGDLRITLVSPAGTRSVLQSLNSDTLAGPVWWTYYSTHCFFEGSLGRWTVEVTDESPTQTGSVSQVELILHGVAITDTDGDGLDDEWERQWLGSLAYSGAEDPDQDGYSNAVEQILQTPPLLHQRPFRLDLSPWNKGVTRLSWPGTQDATYLIYGGNDPGALTWMTNVSGTFPISEWFSASTNADTRFYRVEKQPRP